MDNIAHEPQPPVPSNVEAPVLSSVEGPALLPRTRRDGWTGEKMATFCETLAETAVVAEACDQAGMGISGAYAFRRRSPVFAAAWDAALTIARERLADTLLARSMEGNIELLWKDGVVVGERHLLDNRLGLAILKRLDRLAEATRAAQCTDSVRPERSRGAPAPTSQPFDWTLAIDALRTGDEESLCKALALIKGDEVEEVEDHPFFPGEGDTGCVEIDLSDRCWKDDEGEWMTNFPPPAGFTGHESCDWGDAEELYERDCTPEESAILEADAKRSLDAEREADEELRDTWFDLLRGEGSAGPNGDGSIDG